MAVAREIAVAVYHMISKAVDYVAPRTPDRKKQQENRSEELLRELKKLGYEVTIAIVTP